MQQPIRTRRVLAQRNFVGHAGEGMIRKGQMFDTDPSAAEAYKTAGLAIDAPGRPSAAAAAAASEDDKKQKAAAKGESKDAPNKDASGLEPWPLSGSEEAYLERFGGNPDASDEVKERLKLAKARIKAGVSSGAAG